MEGHDNSMIALYGYAENNHIEGSNNKILDTVVDSHFEGVN
jgi:hypothetical protein